MLSQSGSAEESEFKVIPHLEIRQHYEAVSNPNLGAEPGGTPGGYLMQRYMPSLTVELEDDLLFYVQLKSGIVNGRRGGGRPTDNDSLDLHQAFGKFCLGDGVELKVGRQEMVFGSARLVGNREGPNVRLSFDAIRLSEQWDEGRIDGFVSRPISTDQGVFDNHPEAGSSFWGLYSTTEVDFLPGAGHLDAYYLGLQRSNSRFVAGRADENRHSFGVRLWGDSDGWDYNWEAVYQTGRFGTSGIEAWTVATDTGYTWKDWGLEPRLGLKIDVASGDSNPRDSSLGTFNALYPKGAYFGELALIGPANLVDVHPSIDLKLSPTISFKTELDWFWRQSRADGLYGPALNVLRAPGGSDSKFIGWQSGQTLELKLSPSASYAITYNRFHPGRFLKETGPAQPIDFFASWITFKIKAQPIDLI